LKFETPVTDEAESMALTRSFLDAPDRFLRHLLIDDANGDARS
jgi:hypothetical protein